jgi:hypothetical protein
VHAAAHLDPRAGLQIGAAAGDIGGRSVHGQALDAEARDRDEVADPALELGLVAVIGSAHAGAKGFDHPATEGAASPPDDQPDDVARGQRRGHAAGGRVVEGGGADAQAVRRQVDRGQRAAQVPWRAGVARIDARGVVAAAGRVVLRVDLDRAACRDAGQPTGQCIL